MNFQGNKKLRDDNSRYLEDCSKSHSLAFVYCQGGIWKNGYMFDIFNMMAV